MSEETLQTLARSLRDAGERVALIAFDDTEADSWTYARLAARVEFLAGQLAASGISGGDRVALFADDGPHWVAACLATWRAGAVAVPIDLQLEDRLLSHVIEDSEPSAVFTTSERRVRLPEDGRDPACVTLRLDDENAGDDGDREGRFATRGREDEAILFYTSGTTGRPKGVPLTHANVSSQVAALGEVDWTRSGDRVLLPLPMHHVYPLVMGLLVPLARRIPVILPGALTGPKVLHALHAGEASIVIGVPRLYEALLEGVENRLDALPRPAPAAVRAAVRSSTWLARHTGARIGGWLLAPVRARIGERLRLLGSGGAALSPELAWRLEGLGWRVMSGYGLTETSPLVTLNPPGSPRLESAGRAIPGTEIRIEPAGERGDDDDDDDDGDAGTRRADDAEDAGEILVRGPGVFAGYHGLPEETRAVLDEDGWLRTGDRGRLDENGYLYVLGRMSTLIVTESGKNVDPEAVEAAYEESPAIEEIGVLEQDGALVGVVVPAASAAGGDEPDAVEAAVREALRERARALPSYQRLEDFAVSRERLERTRLGKLKRHLLEERYTQSSQGAQAREDGEPVAIEDMRGEDRALLDDPSARQTWEWLARRYPDRGLGPDTSLGLDLGIDSMDWLNLNLGIQERTGVALDDTAIAEIDTVRDLLNAVSEARGSEGPGTDWLEEPEDALSETQARWLEPRGRAAAFIGRLLHGVDRFLAHVLFRLRVRGGEHRPPADRRVILIANHSSYLDPFVIAAALDHARLRHTCWGGWVGVAFNNPLTRLFSRIARVVPVDPDKGAMSSLAAAAAVLERGESLVWFPEGERSASGELQPFKSGIGMLLEHYPVPVVPMRIEGAYQAWPPHRRMPRLARISVAFGETIDARQLVDEAEDDGEPHRRIAERLHRRFAEMDWPE